MPPHQSSLSTRFLIATSALLISTVVNAQIAPQAPKEFAGRWTTQRLSNDWALKIDRIEPDGKFVGRMDWSGPNCFVRGKEVAGTWAAGKLTVSVQISMKCGDWTLTLQEGGTHAFDGEVDGTGITPTPKAWLDK